MAAKAKKARSKKARDFEQMWNGMTETERVDWTLSAPLTIDGPTIDFTTGKCGYVARLGGMVHVSSVCESQTEASEEAAAFLRRMEKKRASLPD